MTADLASARQSLEALRLGVVPRRGLARLTVGREAESRRVRALTDDGCGLLVVSGHNGHVFLNCGHHCGENELPPPGKLDSIPALYADRNADH